MEQAARRATGSGEYIPYESQTHQASLVPQHAEAQRQAASPTTIGRKVEPLREVTAVILTREELSDDVWAHEIELALERSIDIEVDVITVTQEDA